MNVLTFHNAYDASTFRLDPQEDAGLFCILHTSAFLFGRIRVAIFNAYGWP